MEDFFSPIMDNPIGILKRTCFFFNKICKVYLWIFKWKILKEELNDIKGFDNKTKGIIHINIDSLSIKKI